MQDAESQGDGIEPYCSNVFKCLMDDQWPVPDAVRSKYQKQAGDLTMEAGQLQQALNFYVRAMELDPRRAKCITRIEAMRKKLNRAESAVSSGNDSPAAGTLAGDVVTDDQTASESQGEPALISDADHSIANELVSTTREYLNQEDLSNELYGFSNVTIAAGTVIQSTPINGQVYELITMADTQFPDRELTVDVQVEATQAGESYNLAPGYYSVLPVPVTDVTQVNNGQEWLTTPGSGKESDEELRLRCRNQFTAVGLFHHDAAYKQIISEFSGIRTDFLCFEHNAPRGPGTANCYIMIESGIPSQEFVDDINQHITDNGYHGHGDSMICYPIPAVETDVTVQVWPVANLSAEERTVLQEGIENFIRAAFRQNNDYNATQTWPKIRFSCSRLTQELHRTFSEIDSMYFVNTDVVTSIQLAKLGNLNVQLEY